MRSRSMLLTVLCSLLLVLGAVPGLGRAQDAAPSPDLSQVTLAANDCSWLNVGEEDVVAALGPITCGRLEVPENWQTPGDRRLEISYIVLESTGDDPAPDPVVYLEGGPGGTALAGVPFYARLFAEHRARRDVVLFDQRGTAYSSPLQCSSWTIDDLFGLNQSDDATAGTGAATPAAEEDPEAADPRLGQTAALTADALLEQARSQVADDVARCAQELLAQGVDLRQYNSINNARDTVALIKALGYDAYNLYGISYGTRLAMVIMRDFPRSGLRSVVLDSTYPPGLPGFERYPAEPHEVVVQLFADCFLDPVCNEAYPNLKARFVALLDQLDAAPIELADGTTIDDDDVIEVMQGINGMVQIAPYIPLMIAELEQGNPTTFRGIVTGSLFAGEGGREATPAAAASPVPAATPAADDDAIMDELEPVIAEFVTTIGATGEAGPLSPAQAFLGSVLNQVAALPQGQANQLLVRLLLLDKLPRTRTTLIQFVDRAFAAPARVSDRDALLAQVRLLTDADVAEVFAYLHGPLLAIDPSSAGINSFMFNSVECNESIPFQRFGGTVETAVELEIPALGLNTLPGIAAQFASCEVWPSGRTPAIANRPVFSDVPTLILAGTYDLQTPLSWNKEAFVHLPNAGLLIFPMAGHGVITFSSCAAAITVAFIDDPIYYPDSSCIAGLYPDWVVPPAQ